MLSLFLAVSSCIYSFTSYFIFNDFYIVSLIFYPGLALAVSRGETYALAYTYVRACVLCARSKTEVVTITCKMASV